MAQTLSRTKSVKPAAAVVTEARVVRADRVSSGFARVTLQIEHYDGFEPLGFDQWFRMYLPKHPGAPFALPDGGSDGWYSRLLAMDDAVRPVVRNYTMRDLRRVGSGWEIDADFVVHGSDAGAVDGVALGWALAAHPGEVIGLLDQGTIFAPWTADGRALPGRIVVAADESGVPGAEGIARSLPAGASADFVLEVPNADDRREFATSADVRVQWVVRDAADRPGAALVERFRSLDLDPDGYVYAVGEASAAVELRAQAHRAGVAKDQVDFCAYWRIGRRATRSAQQAA